ncbi:ionotropic receptor 21a [Eupeodes corollae]|uniref:ionotropic receptor 21a n=1 Tax=Eupeodes corollae TaxID=290404 RepID=UPI002491C40B|nr:ionotropic receptor 21a [Eupeodes corollae]
MLWCCLLLVYCVSPSSGLWTVNVQNDHLQEYFEELSLLVSEIMHKTNVFRCFAIITDDTYYKIFGQTVFEKYRRKLNSNFFLKISDTEDLMAPNYQTVRVLKEIRAQNCDLHIIMLSNGNQVRRFLMFVDENRILDTRAKFVMLYDHRVLAEDMIVIWRNILQVVFIRWQRVTKSDDIDEKGEFNLLSIPYPNILNGILSTQVILKWKNHKFHKKIPIFNDKSKDLKGIALRIVAFEHVPMVMKLKNGDFAGVEVEIIRSLEKVMNFKAYFYETNDAETEHWGKILPNRSYTGLIGEMINRQAKLAIGDLQLNILYSNVMDMSEPHSHECFTFLTPESSQDNSWKTLILPFSGNVWAAVIAGQLVVGTIFYLISYTHSVNIAETSRRNQVFFSIFRKRGTSIDSKLFRDVKFRSSLNRRIPRQESTDLFDDYSNCILLTYSMSLFVSLPKMPKNWPLRILTGWYWLYCIMLVVFYRASFTAILANPAPRITIDTIEELSKSRITASVWGTENKKFFEQAFDEIAQEMSEKLEMVDDIYGVTDRIAKGQSAYYDNKFFLRHLRQLGSLRREDTEILHIMKECVVVMPISIGMEKNCPFKANVDKYLNWMKEGGLLSKWLKDATRDLSSEEMAPQEALMNLEKFWSSFAALGFGYILGALTIGSEIFHFKYIVQRHPLYDKYNPKIYYNFQRRFNY